MVVVNTASPALLLCLCYIVLVYRTLIGWPLHRREVHMAGGIVIVIALRRVNHRAIVPIDTQKQAAANSSQQQPYKNVIVQSCSCACPGKTNNRG